jgi:hypothetical protein
MCSKLSMGDPKIVMDLFWGVCGPHRTHQLPEPLILSSLGSVNVYSAQQDNSRVSNALQENYKHSRDHPPDHTPALSALKSQTARLLFCLSRQTLVSCCNIKLLPYLQRGTTMQIPRPALCATIAGGATTIQKPGSGAAGYR